MSNNHKLQLNAPAGNLSSLIAAVDAGADSVYIGCQSPTNLRNLPGLNFTRDEAAQAIQYAHEHGAKVYITINTNPVDDLLDECFRAVDDADDLDADAVIVTDLGVIEYVRTEHPPLEIHLSSAAGAADAAAIRFYREEFGVDWVVLPRVLSLEQIAVLRRQTDVCLEVLVFGVLCANYDGRCGLSSFITGTSALSRGTCAPAEFVQFEEDAGQGSTTVKLGGIAINNFNNFAAAEGRTYPTPCKGRYYSPAAGRQLYAFQDPSCLNALALLPKLFAAGVDVVKIEGRQRSLAYVQLVTDVWRKAIDSLGRENGADCRIQGSVILESVLEGAVGSFGALEEVEA